MKIFKYIFGLFVLLTFTFSCTEQDGIDGDLSFIQGATSSNLAKIFEISNDNSGKVTITPLGDGFSRAIINFGHGAGAAASAEVKPGANVSYAYPEGSYNVVIDYYSIAGNKTSVTYPLTVTYRAPEELKVSLSGETKVKASALFAKSFLVYYGDVANETGTPMAIGEELPAHTYPASGGPFTLKVVALSGGAATTTYTKVLFGFPIDFEHPDVTYFFGTFGGGQKFEKVDNPNKSGLNASNKVGKFTRGHESWSGTYSPLNIPLNFANGNKIKVLAYNPKPENIGKNLNVELEWSINGPANGVGVLKVPFTKSGEWEELIFDFSTITAIPADVKYTQLVLRFNNTADGAGDEIFVDNFRLTN
ncbi:MAG: hypothetical protein IPO94_19410 [Saprospiraceae bacterium]|nr:hypothetical protein [Saprospiraceae bacterium]